MKVLTTSASAQNIDVIPRAYASSYTLKLRDTSKNKEVFSASVSASDSGNFKRLAEGFPEEAEAMENFQHTRGWWADVQDRAEDKKNLTFGTTTIHEVKS